MEAKDVIWKKCLEKIEGTILPDSYATWFSPTYPSSLTDGLITIAVPNQFYRKCLIENYRDLIEKTLKNIADEPLLVEFCVKPETDSHSGTISQGPVATEKPKPNKSDLDPKLLTQTINQRYNFSNFIVGSSNQFAQAAALAVANNPARAYNPLFLYGDVGLGKTHLLHAIGNNICTNNPGSKIRYLSAESFTIDLIESIKKDKMSNFRERYRPLDILLVDDIQFLAGKERTQEEFFYTFNTLYESHKQIVISSDTYPKDLQNIDERLKSRFESGLIADIKPPDLETKVAILYKKAEFHKKDLPQDVAMFIATNIKSNVRQLEGVLLRLVAYSSFTRHPLNLEHTKEILKDFTLTQAQNFTVQNILKTVAAFYDIKVSDIKSKKRTQKVSNTRQIAMYLCREHTKSSLPEIGKQFGGKDHTTVLFSHKKISNIIKENNALKKSVEKILKTIENRSSV